MIQTQVPLPNCAISASGFEAGVQPGQTRSCPPGGSIKSTLKFTVRATFRADAMTLLIHRQKSEVRVGTAPALLCISNESHIA